MIDLDHVHKIMANLLVEHELYWYAGNEFRCRSYKCGWEHSVKDVHATRTVRDETREAHAEHVAALLVLALADLETHPGT